MEPKPATRRPHGFTLLELIVVIAVVVLLAAVLLPALERSKAAGKAAVCKSNLRQIGLGLNLYVNDYEKYPLYATYDFSPLGRTPSTPPELVTTWDNLLVPYCGGQRRLFDCPAWSDKSSMPPWWLEAWYNPNPNREGRFGIFFNFCYGYNASGTGPLIRTGDRKSLGLGDNYSSENTPLPAARVRFPSEMIAMSDCIPGPPPFGPFALAEPYWGPALGVFRHGRVPNVLFCDGHIEAGRRIVQLRQGESPETPTDARAVQR